MGTRRRRSSTAAERAYTVVDNANIHSGMDMLLFTPTHPHWEFVFQPDYAADLNLIKPWRKVLRSLALKGRWFEAWAEIEQAVERATARRAVSASWLHQMSCSFSGCAI
ncbi:hypothetical protein [Siccirubricoccus sp. G192]|uniref:hypothetical protein n=1 Tax=Siccirubricoccus sp. G192 TaxID=2849651 RepID=UPI001C2BB4B2|nr:hypothetical protein [Siccirubricoccus sp. G192]MBV1800468.1 hypothetical protein [Siccirubricoccus sp. G192]